MKTISTLFLATALAAGTFNTYAQNDALSILMQRRAQEEQKLGGGSSSDDTQTSAEISAATNESSGETATTVQTTPAPVMDQAAMDALIATSSTNGIRLNFRNAPLDTVLNYLSAAAGFHIVLEANARGSVTVISSKPMTKDEAVELLNSVLNKNGLAAIRNGQFLTIVSQSDRGRNFPVKVWDSDPASVPNNDEMVTQIIPIRFVEAQQLTRDLASFVSPNATIVANEAGNSIVITDTQANIRHLVEIIKAIDSSAEGETQIRVFPLKYANPTDVATLLGGIFPSQTSGAQNPIRFGGGRGGGGGGGLAAFFAARAGGGGGGNGGGDNNANSQNRIKKQTQVIAVADPRTQSVVVTASKDLMDQIAEMMEKLDVASPRDQKVYVVSTANADPQQLLQVLQSTFPSTTTSRNTSSSSSQNSALMQRQQNSITSQRNNSSTTSGFGNSGVGGGGRGGSAP